MTRRTRIAPTPSGYLHVGNALNAILVWLWARKTGAKLLLRIDDIDQPRVKSEYIDDIFKTMDWIGIDWDEGPSTVGEFINTWSQRHRTDTYREAATSLVDSGFAYMCRCSRTTWADGGYDTCICTASLDDTSEYVVRLRQLPERVNYVDIWMGTQSVPFERTTQAGILLRRDGIPSYQLTSVVDDVSFGVSHVIRGYDLVESTAVQLHVASLMGMHSFSEVGFMHHPLVQVNGEKLSKSAGSTSLKHLRETGTDPKDLIAWVGRCIGQSNATTLSDLLDVFDPDVIPSTENQGWSAG